MTEPTSTQSLYQKGQVYKIVCDLEEYEDVVYVGSTTQTLHKRFHDHKRDSKRATCSSRPLYKLMNELGHDNFRIVLLESFPCSSRSELNAREEHWRQQLGAGLNKIRAHTTYEDSLIQKKQYYQANRDKMLAQGRVYYYNNLEKQREWDRQKYARQKQLTHLCEVCQTTFSSKGNLTKHTKTKTHLAKVTETARD